MAYKMKNPALARQCRMAGAGSPARYSSPVKNRTDKDKVQSDYSKMVNDDSEYGGLSKKQIRQQQRAEKKELRRQGKEEAKELKRFGGDQEKLDAYNAKKAEREANREQYRLDYADDKYDEQGNLTSRGLASQGKGYVAEDEDGDRHYVRATRGGEKARTGAVTRETANKREAYDKMTPEEQEAFKQSELDKLKNMKKSKVEGGESGLNYNDDEKKKTKKERVPQAPQKPRVPQQPQAKPVAPKPVPNPSTPSMDKKAAKADKKSAKIEKKYHKKKLKQAKKIAKYNAKQEKKIAKKIANQEYKQAKEEIKSYTDY